MPTTVAAGIYGATRWPCQRKTFYANGRFWVFFSNGTNLVYYTSTDGITWTVGGSSPIRACIYGERFSIHFDGTYLHYAYCGAALNEAVVYRRGTPNSDGTITWSAVEQTAVPADPTYRYYYPNISVDDGGYAWIGYRRSNLAYYPFVVRSGNNDGTWGTTYISRQLSTTSDSSWVVTPVGMGQTAVGFWNALVVYARDGAAVSYWAYVGGYWLPFSTVSSIGVGTRHSVARETTLLAHLVFLTTGSDIVHVTHHLFDGQGTETTVQAGVSSSSAPVASLDYGRAYLYVFWAGSPTANHIYYKKRVGTTWDASPNDIITETTLTDYAFLSCYFRDYGNKIGLIYQRTDGATYYVRHEFLVLVLTSTDDSATYIPNQRKAFFSQSWYWLFFSDGTNMVYYISRDDVAWLLGRSSPIRACLSGVRFSVCFDGTYLHYAYASFGMGDPLLYRRGTPNADGSITWSAAEQTARLGLVLVYYQYPCVAVSSGGYPFISYTLYYAATLTWTPRMVSSSTNDGTWVLDVDIILNSTSDSGWRTCVASLTGNKIFVTYARAANPILGALTNGSIGTGNAQVGSQETCTSSNANSGLHSTVNEGDHVHLVFLRATDYYIRYVKRTYGVGWGSESTVQASATSTSDPVLSIDINNYLYCFWAGSPTANHIYYKKCVGGTWDADPTDWITETALTANNRLTCYYKYYDSIIGLGYMTGTASPYTIKHNHLTVPPIVPWGGSALPQVQMAKAILGA